MPIKYREEILKCWNDYSKDDNLLRFSPLTCFPEFCKNDYVIVGINPSNSFNSLSPVLNNFINDLEVKHPIKLISDQHSYNEFLMYEHFKHNEAYIIQLQHKCHDYHRHFKKQTNFLKCMGIQSRQFVDLFPIWESNQNALDLFLNQHIELKSRLISSFVDFLVRNNIDKILFLNAGAYNSFENYFFDRILNKVDTRINLGMKNLIFTTGEIRFESAVVKFTKIGIGGYINLGLLINQLKENNLSF